MPDRYGIHIYDHDGNLVARLGDISGQPWGGSAYTLPDGTFGLWGKRDGIWIKAMTQMFYANAASSGLITRSFTEDPLTASADYIFRIGVEETLPFGTIEVPQGRMVSLEVFLHTISQFEWHRTPGGPAWLNLKEKTLESVTLRASLNGGGVSSYDFLSGPSGPGQNSYTSVSVRMVFAGSEDGSAVSSNWDGIRINYFRTIRMFGHEVNESPTWAHYTHSKTQTSDSPEGRQAEGTGGDPGGGAGTDDGGYGGGTPGNPPNLI